MDWKERFAMSHDPQVSSCWVDYDLETGSIEGMNLHRLEQFIAAERRAAVAEALEMVDIYYGIHEDNFDEAHRDLQKQIKEILAKFE